MSSSDDFPNHRLFYRSQADVVLLSFVRANARRRLGFLTEFQRLNVALTRARRSLIVALERTGTPWGTPWGKPWKMMAITCGISGMRGENPLGDKMVIGVING